MLIDWLVKRLRFKSFPARESNEFQAAMLELEPRIRALESAAQGLETMVDALDLLRPRVEFELRLEDQPIKELVVRGKQGPIHHITFTDGVYEDFWTSAGGPDSDLERYATLEKLVWDVAGLSIPRCYARAYEWAKRHGKLRRDIAGVPIMALYDETLKEFEKVDGVWRRRH